MVERLFRGMLATAGLAAEGLLRVGAWYLRLLVWVAFSCTALLAVSGGLLLLGVWLKSSLLLALSPLLTALAITAAIGVLAPVTALIGLLPSTLTEAGRTTLRAMGGAAIAGLLGAVLVRVLPFAENPQLLAVFLALVAVPFLSALVRGKEVLAPFANSARRLALQTLSALLDYLLIVKLVPAEVRARVWNSVRDQVEERLSSSTPQRIPYDSLRAYQAIPKFGEVGGRRETLAAFCEQEGREGPERYILADRPGADTYVGCPLVPLTPEAHRGIERHMQAWEAKRARQQPVLPHLPQPQAPVTTAPAQPSPRVEVVQDVTYRDFVFRLHGCQRGTGGVTCTVTARNWGSQDRYLGVSRSRGIQRNQNYSRLIAADGTEYAMSEATLGGLTGHDVWGMYGLKVDPGRAAGILILFPSVPAAADRFERLVVALGTSSFQDALEEHVDFSDVCVDGCPAGTPDTSRRLTATEAQIGATVVTDDLEFTLDRCRRMGEGLRCEFTATNTATEDLGLALHVRALGGGPAKSSLIAGDGTEYEVAEAQIGSNRLTAHYCESALPAGVKLRGTFRVDRIPAAVASAQQIRLQYSAWLRKSSNHGWRRRTDHAVFRDVSLPGGPI